MVLDELSERRCSVVRLLETPFREVEEAVLQNGDTHPVPVRTSGFSRFLEGTLDQCA